MKWFRVSDEMFVNFELVSSVYYDPGNELRPPEIIISDMNAQQPIRLTDREQINRVRDFVAQLSRNPI